VTDNAHSKAVEMAPPEAAHGLCHFTLQGSRENGLALLTVMPKELKKRARRAR